MAGWFAWNEECIEMHKFSKNAGIFLGHVICVLILIDCFISARDSALEESKAVHTVVVATVEATISPTSKPILTQIPTQKPSEISVYSPTDIHANTTTEIYTDVNANTNSYTCANSRADGYTYNGA